LQVQEIAQSAFREVSEGGNRAFEVKELMESRLRKLLRGGFINFD